MDQRQVDTTDMMPAAAFAARASGAADQRLALLVSTLVADLARLAEEHRLGRDELRRVIGFLSEVGEACSDQRQEWVLLADALGLTSTVERLVTRRPAPATPNTLIGPFYRKGAPERADGESICLDGAGEPLLFTAEVVDLDEAPLPGALVEVWHANADGLYENQAPDAQPEYNLRGAYRSGPDGTVRIRTIRPGGYSIPDDGPVGHLLAQLGMSPERPAHLHFRVSAPGYQTLTTHLFDKSDPAIGSDPLFAVHPALVAEMSPHPEGGLAASFRFVLARQMPAAGHDQTQGGVRT
ncbi:dioxygenase [Pseudoroseicyclus tamaricis]|uniref:6-chlorohydroxyquinol-1,2-dioxygenase n=1 Tax=Pseudoroseicyclus tamaricis TaxID=2705421 RepID=A0A6B2JVU1_9RHOB|nr:dioxygenase [Pseudoroseicyclus tamaricis]NDV02398.1 6-chlorohydroxyquinol-1,2-dioxygenase [Pseudoroseicyclus tamaricis]